MKPQLYQAWFCPFAQRAYIAMLAKGVEFELIEQDPYNKTAEWLDISPRGLVPAIVHEGNKIYESSVCIEYIDEAWTTTTSLLPKDAFQRSRVRMLSDHISKQIVPQYYQIIMKDDMESRRKATNELADGLLYVISQMDDNGPYIMGKNISMADIMLYPHCSRFYILQKYRGFHLPDTGFERFHAWMEAMASLDCVQRTVADKTRLLEKYRRYADDTADTLVATAIREGKGLP